MKKCFLSLFILLLTSTTIFANDAGNKVKILILPFYIEGNSDNTLTDLLYDNFTETINENRETIAINKSLLETALNSLNIQKNSRLDIKEAITIGEIVKAQVVIINSIVLFNSEFYISIKGIDTNSGRELFIKTGKASNSRELILAVNKLISPPLKNISEKEGKNNNSTFRNIDNLTDENKKKLINSYVAGGALLAAIGGAGALTATIFMQLSNSYVLNSGPFSMIGGPIITILATAIASLSAIPFWFAYKIERSRNNNRVNDIKRFSQFLTAGITLAAISSTLLLGGIISMSVLMNYKVYDARARYAYTLYFLDGLMVGEILLPLGVMIFPLSIIFFCFAYATAKLHKKETGEKLSFWNRAHFNAGFVTTKNSLTNEFNRKISIGMSISL